MQSKSIKLFSNLLFTLYKSLKELHMMLSTVFLFDQLYIFALYRVTEDRASAGGNLAKQDYCLY